MLVASRAAPRPSVIGEFLPKLEELIERSKGKVRADVAHDKIAAMGLGSRAHHPSCSGAVQGGVAGGPAAGAPARGRCPRRERWRLGAVTG
jgi:hypothetical protein